MSDPSSQAQHLRPGDRVGTYEVLEQVAAGGESIVYHGRDVTLHRSVALKQVVAALDAPDVRSAVLREAARHKAAAASDPTYVLQIIEVLDVARGPIVACEWIDGVTLEHTLAGQTEPMPLKRALGIIAAAAIGLRAIHAAGLVHRDVKPANILLPEAGGVKLADFGLASAIAEHATLSAGSTRYLAPEALRGQPYEPRADLYSLGVVAYEALAGRAAFHRAFRSVLRDESGTPTRGPRRRLCPRSCPRSPNPSASWWRA